jgi:hypothetical protein
MRARTSHVAARRFPGRGAPSSLLGPNNDESMRRGRRVAVNERGWSWGSRRRSVHRVAYTVHGGRSVASGQHAGVPLETVSTVRSRDKFSRRRDFRRRANVWFHVSCWAYREHPFRLRLIRAELGNCFSGNHG